MAKRNAASVWLRCVSVVQPSSVVCLDPVLMMAGGCLSGGVESPGYLNPSSFWNPKSPEAVIWTLNPILQEAFTNLWERPPQLYHHDPKFLEPHDRQPARSLCPSHLPVPGSLLQPGKPAHIPESSWPRLLRTHRLPCPPVGLSPAVHALGSAGFYASVAAIWGHCPLSPAFSSHELGSCPAPDL